MTTVAEAPSDAEIANVDLPIIIEPEDKEGEECAEGDPGQLTSRQHADAEPGSNSKSKRPHVPYSQREIYEKKAVTGRRPPAGPTSAKRTTCGAADSGATGQQSISSPAVGHTRSLSSPSNSATSAAGFGSVNGRRAANSTPRGTNGTPRGTHSTPREGASDSGHAVAANGRDAGRQLREKPQGHAPSGTPGTHHAGHQANGRSGAAAAVGEASTTRVGTARTQSPVGAAARPATTAAGPAQVANEGANSKTQNVARSRSAGSGRGAHGQQAKLTPPSKPQASKAAHCSPSKNSPLPNWNTSHKPVSTTAAAAVTTPTTLGASRPPRKPQDAGSNKTSSADAAVTAAEVDGAVNDVAPVEVVEAPTAAATAKAPNSYGRPCGSSTSSLDDCATTRDAVPEARRSLVLTGADSATRALAAVPATAAADEAPRPAVSLMDAPASAGLIRQPAQPKPLAAENRASTDEAMETDSIGIAGLDNEADSASACGGKRPASGAMKTSPPGPAGSCADDSECGDGDRKGTAGGIAEEEETALASGCRCIVM